MDVIDGDEVDRAVIEGEVRWPVDSFIGFVAEFVVFRGVVDVVVADDVVPGDADVAERSVEIIEQVEVIEEDIAECDSESGPGSDKFFDDVVGDEVEFLLIAGLWVTEEDDIERCGFR